MEGKPVRVLALVGSESDVVTRWISSILPSSESKPDRRTGSVSKTDSPYGMRFDSSAFLVENTPEEPTEIPKYIIDILNKAEHDGVYFKRTKDKTGFRHMGWRPGDHNPLAQAIIDHVDERYELDLDGHKFWIEPQ